ncbi:hypothetical protein QFZ30_004013 [Arthrobacter pascens]|nr:hypothetical protein [Arthrobacter pascens]
MVALGRHVHQRYLAKHHGVARLGAFAFVV